MPHASENALCNTPKPIQVREFSGVGRSGWDDEGLSAYFGLPRIESPLTEEGSGGDKHCLRYKGFSLHCDPIPLDDGHFSSRLTLGLGSEETKRVFTLTGYFDTEEEAADAAFLFGKRWVDYNGKVVRLVSAGVRKPTRNEHAAVRE